MKIRNNISFTTIEENTVLVNSITNEQIMLDEIGTEIWKLVLTMNNIEEIINFLQIKYLGFDEKISEDVTEFVNMLKDRGVLDV